MVAPVAGIQAAIDNALLLRPSFDPASDTHEFSISMADYALPLLLRPLVGRLASRAPNVSIHIHSPLQRMQRLAPGDVDLVISPTVDTSADSVSGLRSEPLYSDTWVCVVDAPTGAWAADRRSALNLSPIRAQLDNSDYAALPVGLLRVE